jgi:hypothetical protein
MHATWVDSAQLSSRSMRARECRRQNECRDEMPGLHRITSGFAEWTAHDCIERPYDTARSHLVCLVLASVAYVMASQGSTGANCDEAMRTSLIRIGTSVR